MMCRKGDASEDASMDQRSETARRDMFLGSRVLIS